MAFQSWCPYSMYRKSSMCGRRPHLFGMDWNEWLLQLSLLSDYNNAEKKVKTEANKIISNDNNKFEIKLDVSHYSAEEITVKIVDKNIVIECKHEEKKDEFGWISRQFSRRFQLPEDIDIAGIHSTLSSTGILTVEVPKKIFKKKEENVVLIAVIHENESKNSSEEQKEDKEYIFVE